MNFNGQLMTCLSQLNSPSDPMRFRVQLKEEKRDERRNRQVAFTRTDLLTFFGPKKPLQQLHH